ncbi:hypothetical protein ACFYMO_28195 [Streptomyces sp. NPDC007025]|uniref:hypothetical protein n=1 Tax=Streptomyces sp. NPDC007025 TaxID=3364771 RepID=UPI003695DEA4
MTTTPDRRRSMVVGAMQVPLRHPGWTHSHSTNAVRLPGVMAVTGRPSNEQNRCQSFQSEP